MDMSLKEVMLAPELPEYLAWIMTLAKVPIFLITKFSKTTIANDILDTAAVHCTFVFKRLCALLLSLIRPVNLANISKPASVSPDSLTSFEQENLARAGSFKTFGTGYFVEHGTKTSTIGHVISSSPVALLAWYVNFRSFL
jgi:hypothetical protein